MNLYDIQKSQYDEELLALAAGVHTEIDNVSKEDPKYKNQLINLNKIREKFHPLHINHQENFKIFC